MRRVLYLHGFASSPAGRKIALLRETLSAGEFEVAAPDLNRPSFERLDFDEIAREAVRAASAAVPDVVVGSSLGALVALEACRRGVRSPLVLIAPALGFGARWTEKLAPGDPVAMFHHGENRELAIHRRFFEEMARIEVDRDPPVVPVTVLMGTEDGSVPFDGVEAVWRGWEASGRLAAGSKFISISGGDHGLVAHVDRIAGEIRAAAATG